MGFTTMSDAAFVAAAAAAVVEAAALLVAAAAAVDWKRDLTMRAVDLVVCCWAAALDNDAPSTDRETVFLTALTLSVERERVGRDRACADEECAVARTRVLASKPESAFVQTIGSEIKKRLAVLPWQVDRH